MKFSTSPIKCLSWQIGLFSLPGLIFIGLLSIGATACSQRKISQTISPSQTPTADATVTITVSAAASLQNPLQEIQIAYKKHQPRTTIVHNFGSSGSLMQQISQGAPVDVFLSASEDWMDKLSESGEIVEASRKQLLKNALVLITSSKNAGIDSFQDLEAETSIKIAVGEPNSVPLGRYTQELLRDLDLLQVLQSQLVFGKDARQVLTYVETGNATAGVVYATDALASERVSVIAAANPQMHSAITYPVAVVQDSQQRESAKMFVDFLSTQTAQDIFERYGFEVLP